MRWLITVFSITCLFFVCNGAEIRRQKRALWQFPDMISCTTRLSYVNVLNYYNGYGCYCGQGGYGTPVDALDMCCEAHDTCYQSLRDVQACSDLTLIEIYAMSYKYSVNRCWSRRPSITCTAASEYDGSSNLFGLFGFIEVDSPNPVCAAGLCECDAIAARCFASKQYNYDFKDYDRINQC